MKIDLAKARKAQINYSRTVNRFFDEKHGHAHTVTEFTEAPFGAA